MARPFTVQQQRFLKQIQSNPSSFSNLSIQERQALLSSKLGTSDLGRLQKLHGQNLTRSRRSSIVSLLVDQEGKAQKLGGIKARELVIRRRVEDSVKRRRKLNKLFEKDQRGTFAIQDGQKFVSNRRGNFIPVNINEEKTNDTKFNANSNRFNNRKDTGLLSSNIFTLSDDEFNRQVVERREKEIKEKIALENKQFNFITGTFESKPFSENNPNINKRELVKFVEGKPFLTETNSTTKTFLGKGADFFDKLANKEDLKQIQTDSYLAKINTISSSALASGIRVFEPIESGIRTGIDVLDESSKKETKTKFFKGFEGLGNIVSTVGGKNTAENTFKTFVGVGNKINTQGVNLDLLSNKGIGSTVGTLGAVFVPIPFVKGTRTLPKGTGQIDDLSISARRVDFIDSTQPIKSSDQISLPNPTTVIKFKEGAGDLFGRIGNKKIDTTIREFPSGTTIRTQKIFDQEFITVQKPNQNFATVTKFGKNKKISTTKIDPIDLTGGNNIAKTDLFDFQPKATSQKIDDLSITQSLKKEKNQLIRIDLQKNQFALGELKQFQRVTAETTSTPFIIQNIKTTGVKKGNKGNVVSIVDDIDFKPANLELGDISKDKLLRQEFLKSTNKNLNQDLFIDINPKTKSKINFNVFTLSQKSTITPKPITKTIVERGLISDLVVINPSRSPKGNLGKKGSASLGFNKPSLKTSRSTLNIDKVEFPKSKLDFNIDLNPLLKPSKSKLKASFKPAVKPSLRLDTRTNLLQNTNTIQKLGSVQNIDLIQKTHSIQKIGSIQKVKKVQKTNKVPPIQDINLIQRSSNILRTDFTPPKPSINFFPDVPSLPKTRKKNDLTGFNVFVKTKEGYDKQNKKPLSSGGAFNLGARVTDETPATVFKITESKKQRKPQILAHFFNPMLANKFKKSEKKKNKYIERKAFRLDALGERPNKPIKLGNIEKNTVLFEL